MHKSVEIATPDIKSINPNKLHIFKIGNILGFFVHFFFLLLGCTPVPEDLAVSCIFTANLRVALLPWWLRW